MSVAARDAASVVLGRDGASGLEVLMVRRAKSSSFMGDAFVFPGGRVDEFDHLTHPTERTHAWTPAVLQAIGGEAIGGACLVAGIRELFEEAGILLATDGRGAPPAGVDLEAVRRSVHQRERRFHEALTSLGLRLDLGALCFFARWVTPSSEPRRFDARFFLARTVPGQTALHEVAELSEHRWGTPQAFLEEHAEGRIKLPPPTVWHLTDLAKFDSTAHALSWASVRAARVAAVQPKLVALGDTLGIILPWDREYPSFDGEGQPLAPDHPVAGPVTRFVLIDGRWVGRSG